MKRYYVTTRYSDRCARCDRVITTESQVAPYQGGWCCNECDELDSDVTSILRWLSLSRGQRRVPKIDEHFAAELIQALGARGIVARNRGTRDKWHPPGSRTAALEWPFIDDAMGLLEDSLEHQFAVRMPGPGVEAIIKLLSSPDADPGDLG